MKFSAEYHSNIKIIESCGYLIDYFDLFSYCAIFYVRLS